MSTTPSAPLDTPGFSSSLHRPWDPPTGKSTSENSRPHTGVATPLSTPAPPVATNLNLFGKSTPVSEKPAAPSPRSSNTSNKPHVSPPAGLRSSTATWPAPSVLDNFLSMHAALCLPDLHQLATAVNDMKGDLGLARLDLSYARADIKKLTGDCTASKAALAEAQKEAEEERARTKEIEATADASRLRSLEWKAVLESELADLRDKYASLTTAHHDITSKHQSLVTTHAQELVFMVIRLSNATIMKESALRQADAALNDNNSLRVKLATTDSEFEVYRSSVKAEHEEYQTMEIRLSDATIMKEVALRQADAALKDNNSLRTKLTATEFEFEVYKSRASLLETILERPVIQAYKQRTEDAAATRAIRIKDLEEELTMLKAEEDAAARARKVEEDVRREIEAKQAAVEKERKRCQDRDKRWSGDSGPVDRFIFVLDEFSKIKFGVEQPVVLGSVPWPTSIQTQSDITLESITSATVEEFFERLKRHITQEEYRTLLTKAKHVFHPDRWSSRNLFTTVAYGEVKVDFEKTITVVSQTINALVDKTR